VSHHLVLDTNIVLDTLVFRDPRTHALHAALFDEPVMPDLLWLATAPMREELARVLAYPHIAVRLAFHGLQAEQVLSQFDSRVRIVPVAPKAPVTCKDPDDQKFIDLAVSHSATITPQLVCLIGGIGIYLSRGGALTPRVFAECMLLQ
jgi:putative PIN family toxin of toxin-antitoxin system